MAEEREGRGGIVGVAMVVNARDQSVKKIWRFDSAGLVSFQPRGLPLDDAARAKNGAADDSCVWEAVSEVWNLCTRRGRRMSLPIR